MQDPTWTTTQTHYRQESLPLWHLFGVAGEADVDADLGAYPGTAGP